MLRNFNNNNNNWKFLSTSAFTGGRTSTTISRTLRTRKVQRRRRRVSVMLLLLWIIGFLIIVLEKQFLSNDTFLHHEHKQNLVVVVSGRHMEYRINIHSFLKYTSASNTNNDNIIVGVLSSSERKNRRQVIRETWAYNRTGIFFIVAGPWEDIEQEYNARGDLLWLNTDEVYDKTKSFLPFKSFSFLSILGSLFKRSVLPLETLSFLSIIGNLSNRYNRQYSYAFKTDDDSYVNMQLLEEVLFRKSERDEPHDFVGKTSSFFVSKHFLNLAVEGNHIQNPIPSDAFANENDSLAHISRLIGIEKVSCGSIMELFFSYRGHPTGIQCNADMRRKIVQNSIIDDEDMKNHHQSLFDPQCRSYLDHRTGYRANCAMDNSMITAFPPDGSITHDEHKHNNMSDDGVVLVSCRHMEYRINIHSFLKHTSASNTNNIAKNDNIIVGILSSSKSKNRRQVIRETWAYNRTGIFFIVAGPWEDIEQEYNARGDLLWLNTDEVYDNTKSVLPFKSLSFLSIIEDLSNRYNRQYSYAFKTDDDSYVNMQLLEEVLSRMSERDEPYDYVGRCNDYTRPLRIAISAEQEKWCMSNETYPEDLYPQYCVGAGYVLSKRFLSLVREGKHFENIRYLPLEDVQVGLIAARVGIKPPLDDDIYKQFVVHQTECASERIVTMKGKIVQHHIIDDDDMKNHHKSLTCV
jgi:hypothetical protein